MELSGDLRSFAPSVLIDDLGHEGETPAGTPSKRAWDVIAENERRCKASS